MHHCTLASSSLPQLQGAKGKHTVTSLTDNDIAEADQPAEQVCICTHYSCCVYSLVYIVHVLQQVQQKQPTLSLCRAAMP
jgi:hypothetical protein